MTSPAHRQYLDIKKRHPDEIVLFRMGDFYEMFDEDARVGSETLGITLTSRPFAKGEARVAMAGFPNHALQPHLKRFVQNGIKVAICEQLSEPGKGLVERDVVRVVTPGTLVEDALLDAKKNNYLAAVHAWKDRLGLAYVDVTTGEFAVTEFSGGHAAAALEAEVLRLQASEHLLAVEPAPVTLPGHTTRFDDYRFDPDTARETLCRHFGVQALEGFGCEALPAGIGAAGAIISYVENSNRGLLGLLSTLRTYHVSSYMTIDRYTRRHLELTEGARSGAVRGSLLWVLDRTQTAMGGRLLRRLLGQPLLAVEPLNQRLDAVEELAGLPVLRTQLRASLAKVADLERLSGRVRQGIALSRDLLALRDSLRCGVELRALLTDAGSDELRRVLAELDPCTDLIDIVDRAVAEGESSRLIKPNFDSELDGMIASIKDARDWIAGLEAVERDRTGIRSLKVGYNRVFGYYIEVSHSNSALVPADYIRKQTLVNAERYITPELKEYESRILQAEERISTVERRLFGDLLTTIGRHQERLLRTADAAAFLDLYRSLADVAAQYRYVRPELEASDRLDIAGGRHPVVEASLVEGFVPNDCALDCTERQILLVTGPNMGGKSTYLRQVALIVLMAQIGSFVPADRACIGLVDRIFSRVGAQDDIAAGQSTFMVEMVETANILNHATARSLLVLDEVGRGTSTYDGLAIARAVVEHIHDTIGARTLFATHFHELTDLADLHTRIHNASVAVAEDGSDVIFLHRVVAGGADRSYGVHVARLAGLPTPVTQRAEEALQDLESRAGQNGNGNRRRYRQASMFADANGSVATQVLDDLLSLDVNTLTPLEAMTRLADLQRKGRGGLETD